MRFLRISDDIAKQFCFIQITLSKKLDCFIKSKAQSDCGFKRQRALKSKFNL